MRAKKKLVVSKTQVKRPIKPVKVAAPRKNKQTNVDNAIQPNTSPNVSGKSMKTVKPKIIKSAPASNGPSSFTDNSSETKATERAETRYKEQYGFTNKASARSPVSKYEVERVADEMKGGKDNPYGTHYSPKEAKLISGAPHSFGHTGTQIQGKLRYSGNKSAHRIGKR